MQHNPNVLLIIMDAVRARNTSLHGYRNETTPFLEEFSQNATNYSQARSSSINSIASHTSIFTGHHAFEHGVECTSDTIRTGSTIWDTLRDQHQYQTGLFTSNLVITGSSNLADSFEFVEQSPESSIAKRRKKIFPDAFGPTDISQGEGVRGNIKRSFESESPIKSVSNCVWRALVEVEEKVRSETSHKERPAHEFIDPFLDWIDRSDRPWAACLNFMDAHQPYRPLETFDLWGGKKAHSVHDYLKSPKDVLGEKPWWMLKALESLYDGGIRQGDDAIREIIRQLERQGILEDTLVVITSDHGEGFGERSFVTPEVRAVTHSWGLHECLTHVPLVVKYPGQSEGKEISNVVSLAEFPNVVEAILNDDTYLDSFVTDDPVIASTSKLFEKELEKVPGATEAYLGPWLAVYENHGDVIKKYVTHREQSATVVIRDAKTAYKESDSGADKVSSVFKNFEKTSLKMNEGENALNDEVEQQLKDLGYIQ